MKVTVPSLEVNALEKWSRKTQRGRGLSASPSCFSTHVRFVLLSGNWRATGSTRRTAGAAADATQHALHGGSGAAGDVADTLSGDASQALSTLADHIQQAAGELQQFAWVEVACRTAGSAGCARSARRKRHWQRLDFWFRRNFRRGRGRWRWGLLNHSRDHRRRSNGNLRDFRHGLRNNRSFRNRRSRWRGLHNLNRGRNNRSRNLGSRCWGSGKLNHVRTLGCAWLAGDQG